MFVGHLGIGLALSSSSPRFRLGTLLGAVLLLDVLLGVFVLAGMEQVIVPVLVLFGLWVDPAPVSAPAAAAPAG